MGKLEKDVSKDVRTALDTLEREGAVLWWTRLNTGKVKTNYGSWIQLCEVGTPDYIAILSRGEIYFIETKSDSGKQSKEQIEFQKRVSSWAIYEVVRYVEQVYGTVELTTGHYKRKLDGIEL